MPGRYEVYFDGSVSAYYYRVPGSLAFHLTRLESSSAEDSTPESRVVTVELPLLKAVDKERKQSLNGTFWLGEIDMPWEGGAKVLASWQEHNRCHFEVRRLVFRYIGAIPKGDLMKPLVAVEVGSIRVPQEDFPEPTLDSLLDQLRAQPLEGAYCLRRLQVMVHSLQCFEQGTVQASMPLAVYLREHLAEGSAPFLSVVESEDMRLKHVLAFAKLLDSHYGESTGP